MSRLLGLAALLAAVFVAAATAGTTKGLQRAEAFVKRHCHNSVLKTDMWQLPSSKFHALYGNCQAGDGHDQHIWFFDGSRFLGTDGKTSSGAIIGLWRDSNTMGFLYVLYRSTDPACCATGGGAVVRFRWTGKRVKRLDPLPRRSASATHPGRYP